MTKSILKKVFLGSCFSFLLLMSCEKEYEEEEISIYPTSIKKEKVNFEDFKHNKGAFDAYQKLNITESNENVKNVEK